MVTIRLHDVVFGEVVEMLSACAATRDSMAESILRSGNNSQKSFIITREQAIYLSQSMLGDADRVSEVAGPLVGDVYLQAGLKLAESIST